MLDSNVDDELALLGQIRTDVHAIVARWLGEKPLTLDEVDSLLANLGEEGAIAVRESSPSVRERTPLAAPAPEAAAIEPAAIEPAAVASAPAIAASAPDPVASAVVASAPALTSTALAEAPLTESAAPVLDEKPDPEAQAQAIVAAFEQPEVDQSSTEALAAELESSLSELEASTRAAAAENARALDAERPVRRPERSQGSRRPDLNELLDQPLDALDFERTEPVDEDAPGAQARHSDMPTGAPPAPASGDDFEILVDDEILEIAEDDVEMVNDDEESN